MFNRAWFANGKRSDERGEMLPSGAAFLFDDRVGWVRTYLKRAATLELQRRGIFSVTEMGKQLLAENPPSIDVAFLGRFPEFREFRTRRRDRHTSESVVRSPVLFSHEADTPEDVLAYPYNNLRKNLEKDLLEQVYASSLAFFEQLMVELLVKVGYGGSRRDAGMAIGQSGDEGIDGIINGDKLGLDVIYIQARRWGLDKPVGRSEMQKFAGVLQGK